MLRRIIFVQDDLSLTLLGAESSCEAAVDFYSVKTKQWQIIIFPSCGKKECRRIAIGKLMAWGKK